MIPEGLAEVMRESADGRAWLERLPGLVSYCAELWDLTLGEPYTNGYASLTMPATRTSGEPVVLKVQYPHRESDLEAEALRMRAGNGSVRLLEHDPERSALLLERCEPGTPLHDLASDDALDIVIELLPRLWRPAGAPFSALADEATHWRADLDRALVLTTDKTERRALDATSEALDALVPTQGGQVLVDQDLQATNVLRAKREPWLAIDPKPLTGEREFGVVAIVRGDELGRGRANVLHRLDRVTADLGLDWERTRAWTYAHTIAWALDDDGRLMPDHLETAAWLMDAPAR